MKLSPIERSIVDVLQSVGRALNMREIVKRIRYVRQDHLNEWLKPILCRMSMIGAIRQKRGYFSL